MRKNLLYFFSDYLAFSNIWESGNIHLTNSLQFNVIPHFMEYLYLQKSYGNFLLFQIDNSEPAGTELIKYTTNQLLSSTVKLIVTPSYSAPVQQSNSIPSLACTSSAIEAAGDPGIGWRNRDPFFLPLPVTHRTRWPLSLQHVRSFRVTTRDIRSSRLQVRLHAPLIRLKGPRERLFTLPFRVAVSSCSPFTDFHARLRRSHAKKNGSRVS